MYLCIHSLIYSFIYLSIYLFIYYEWDTNHFRQIKASSEEFNLLNPDSGCHIINKEYVSESLPISEHMYRTLPHSSGPVSGHVRVHGLCYYILSKRITHTQKESFNIIAYQSLLFLILYCQSINFSYILPTGFHFRFRSDDIIYVCSIWIKILFGNLP